MGVLALLSGVVVLSGAAGDHPVNGPNLVSADTHPSSADHAAAQPAASGAVARRPALLADRQHVGRRPVLRHAASRARTHHSVQRAGRHAARRLDLAPSDAHETVKSALSSDFNVPGHCLEWARERADIPPVYDDAATAWANATGKRPGDRHPPVGAAVYWTGGTSGYGHIAISVGDGKVRSTDAGGEGRVKTVGVDWATKAWGLRYAGWANSINGYTIPGVVGRA